MHLVRLRDNSKARKTSNKIEFRVWISKRLLELEAEYEKDKSRN